MTLHHKARPFTGQAKAALVFAGETDPTALITSIVARGCLNAGKRSLGFSGPVIFSKEAVGRIETVVWPLAKRIFQLLEVPIDGFDISIANPGVASMGDMGIEITGFSTEVPVFLAILSAGLRMGISEKAAFTGHVASADGTIGMVKAIPAKLEAAIKDPSIEVFVYPDVERERSVSDLAPQTKRQIEGAIAQAKNQITPIGVRDMSDLVRAAFSEDEIVKASLKTGFFGLSGHSLETDTVIERTAHFITDNLDSRFYNTLSEYLSQGQGSEGSRLLSAFIEFHLNCGIYPQRIGRKLFQVVVSLPPTTRRIKIQFPLVSMGACIELGQYAKDPEDEDVLLLLKACSGDGVSNRRPSQRVSSSALDLQKNDLLEAILSEIGADNLTEKIAKPINQARATYVMDATVASHENFIEIITSFYLHVLRHIRSVIDPVDKSAVSAEALALLERTFAKDGGFQGALAEARHATNGGVRLVLDSLTRQFIREQQEKHIDHVLKTAMDPLDWDGKVKLIDAIIKRLRPYLPADIVDQPAERFAVQYEQIVRAYSQTLDQITSFLRLF